MRDDKVVIHAKIMSHLKPGQQAVVKISPKCHDILVDIANESGRPLNRIASAIIEQAYEKDLIELERCFATEDDE